MNTTLMQVLEKLGELSETQQMVIARSILDQIQRISSFPSSFNESMEPNHSLIKGSKAILKLVNVKEDFTPSHSYFNGSEGSRVVAIQVIIDNTHNDEDFRCNPAAFTIKDKEGNCYSKQTSAIEPSLPLDDVEAGELLKGWITFHIPDSILISNPIEWS